jgi:hypothetical protein
LPLSALSLPPLCRASSHVGSVLGSDTTDPWGGLPYFPLARQTDRQDGRPAGRVRSYEIAQTAYPPDLPGQSREGEEGGGEAAASDNIASSDFRYSRISKRTKM